MTTAMDREFYDRACFGTSPARRKELVESVAHGLDRLSQLANAMPFVSCQSRPALLAEIAQEQACLHGNMAALKSAVAAKGGAMTVSGRECSVIQKAEKVIQSLRDCGHAHPASRDSVTCARPRGRAAWRG